MPFRLISSVLAQLTPAEPSIELEHPLPYMEIVRLPCYLIAVETIAKGSARDVDVLIGGCDGQFALVGAAGLGFESDDGIEAFPPTINESEAIQQAQSGLVTAIMRSPGWGAKPDIGGVASVELVQAPYWVYYYERRRGRLDIKVLDAVTGNIPGPKVKLSMIQAFVNADCGDN